MRKSTFLKLIGVAEPNTLSKTVILGYVSHKLISFGMENMGDNIWPILWLLSWKQSSFNLWPTWICSHSEEEVCSAVKVTVDSKCILTGSLHMPCASSERRRK